MSARLLALMVLASACGAPVTSEDGGRADGHAIQLVCETDAQCSDGRFCNGAERCDPGAPGADSRGCLLGVDPCPGQRCEEAAGACSSCDVADADGDGHDDIGCGGDDCDDADPQRYPGNLEVCDPFDRDEDCDPDTLGADGDGDGEAPSHCCNTIAGALRCGTDCDDTRATINTDAIEVCNGVDEDCDGTLDEGVPHSIFPDDDGDGFGRTRDGIASCTLPPGGGFSFLGGDCDDGDPRLNPRNTEECNEIDDDCDHAVDEGCPCEPGEARPCGLRDEDGFVEIGGCHSGDQICRERRWSSCIMASAPEEERCNHVDDDCDGSIDEGQTILLFIDEDGDGAGNSGEPRRSCGALAGYVRTGGDCDDSNPAVSPSGSEVCNGVDDDCDGIADDGIAPRDCSTACGSGVETCNGGAFGGCTAPMPAPETCNDIDDDCDGTVDGITRACSSACGPGLETCTAGVFGACTAPAPTAETCNDVDDDCDGTVDGMTQGCSTACGSGIETCTAGVFGGCTAPMPVAETCNDADDDCDGAIDDGVTRSCSTACGSGIETCTAGVFGGCTARTPTAETCNNVDDDCDGVVDGMTRGCSTACGSGIETCTSGSFGGCTASTGPCDLTPTMTGFTTPSGTVTSSGDFGGYPAWQAFDAAAGAGGMWLSEQNVTPAWVAYEFSAPRTVVEYGIHFTNGDSLVSRAPRDWELQGFDGAAWVRLDARTGQTAWGGVELRRFTIATPGAYRSYRLYVTQDNDDRTGSAIVVLSIGELLLTGY